MSKGRKHYDHLLSLLLLGDSGVGKSALLMRFAEDNFTESFIATIGIDFKIKTITLNNKTIKLQIWDTAGQEKFRTITSAYYRGAMGILLVYDLNDEQSFLNVRNWMRQIKQYAAEEVVMMLCGNKCDMETERVISIEQGQDLAKEFKIGFYETSAKLDINVEEAFIELSTKVLEKWGDQSKKDKKDKLIEVSGSRGDEKKGNKCCK